MRTSSESYDGYHSSSMHSLADIVNIVVANIISLIIWALSNDVSISWHERRHRQKWNGQDSTRFGFQQQAYGMQHNS